MIELRLPLPPSKNALRQRTKTGIARTGRYEDWLFDAGFLAIQQRRGQGKIPGRYKLSIEAVRPDDRKRDLGNLLEATEDLLTAVGIIPDDSFSEMISMRWVTGGEGITVRIENAGVE